MRTNPRKPTSISPRRREKAIGGPTLVTLLAAAVERNPDHTALISDDAELSYRALDGLGNALARRLCRQGLGTEDLVALASSRDHDGRRMPCDSADSGDTIGNKHHRQSRCDRAEKVEGSAGSRRALGTKRMTAATATRQITGLIANIQRHPGPSTSTPPATKPSDPLTAVALPQAVDATVRARPSGKSVTSSASVIGEAKPAATPCTPRKPIKAVALGARAQANEARPNIDAPAMKTLRWPYRSPVRPPSGRDSPKQTVYAVITHCSMEAKTRGRVVMLEARH